MTGTDNGVRAARTPDPLPELTAAVSKDGYLLPHHRSFNAIYNMASKLYSYRWDEAYRQGREQAQAMRRDPYFRSLLQERLKPLARWPIDIKLVDEKQANDETEQIRNILLAIHGKTKRHKQQRYYLGNAIWYGRYGSQHTIEKRPVGGFMRWCTPKHSPINGDKIQLDWNGTYGVMINGTFQKDYPDVRIGDASAPVMMLSRPDVRQRFIIHEYDLEDADYWEADMAGRVGGIGLRDYCYWGWWLRDELISWIFSFMEKVGSMGILCFYYQAGNAEGKARAEKSAREVGNGNALSIPVPQGDPRVGSVELIPANVTGAQFLVDAITQWFERHIERLIVGQSMSGGADNDSGLGGTGRAEFAKDTKFQLLASDADDLAETLTADWLMPMQRLNNLGWGKYEFRFDLRVPDPESKDKLAAVQTAVAFGVSFEEDEVRELTSCRKPRPGVKTIGGQQGGAGPMGPNGQPMPPQGPQGPNSPVPNNESPENQGDLDDVGAGGPHPEAGDQGQIDVPPEVLAAMATLAEQGDWAGVEELQQLAGDPEGLQAFLEDDGAQEQTPMAYEAIHYAAAAPAKKKYASTHVLLQGEARKRLLSLAKLIPDYELGNDGREDDPHVTVKYGLHTDDPKKVAEVVGGVGAVHGTLTEVNAFYGEETGKDYDVLIVKVSSPELHDLNSWIAERLEHTDTWPDYKPHATIAYLKKGLAKKYVEAFGSLDIPFEVNHVVFSNVNRVKSLCDLHQPNYVEYSAPPITFHYQWTAGTTKTGKLKAVWAGGGKAPLYGKRAEAALRGKQEGQQQATGTKQMLIDRKKAAEPGRETARQQWQQALQSGVNSQQLPQLVEHLHNLTRNELREMVRGLEQRVGGLKTDLVQRLVDHASSRPTKQDTDMSMEAMDHTPKGPLPRQRTDRPDPTVAEAEARNAADMGKKAKAKAKPNKKQYGYTANFDISKLDNASKRELGNIEGTALKTNQNEPIIVTKNDDGSYKVLDGYGRISGLRNAGKSTAHAIVISGDDLPAGMKTIADDADTIAELHYKYRPESHLAKPGGSESSGVYYNTFDDAIDHGEYDPIYPFMVDKDAWVKMRMNEDGYSKADAEKEHRGDVEDTLKTNPKLLHRFILQKYPDLAPKATKSAVDPETDLPGFAKAVQELADTAPEEHMFGDSKVYISDLYDLSQESGGFPKMTLDEFKKALMKANNQLHLNLRRADLVQEMPEDKVEKSESNWGNNLAQFHFVTKSPKKK